MWDRNERSVPVWGLGQICELQVCWGAWYRLCMMLPGTYYSVHKNVYWYLTQTNQHWRPEGAEILRGISPFICPRATPKIDIFQVPQGYRAPPKNNNKARYQRNSTVQYAHKQIVSRHLAKWKHNNNYPAADNPWCEQRNKLLWLEYVQYLISILLEVLWQYKCGTV